MKIEHIGLQVPEPVAAAEWYVKHLGLRIVRRTGPPTHTHFLADDSGQTLIEIYNNPKAGVPDYPAMDPLILHLAVRAEDVKAARAKLLAAGATAVGDITVTDAGDELAMLRDPWGFPIQLARRKTPMA